MIGQTIAHYRITGKLGEGGMGEVYRATDTNLGREAAIKVLPAEIAADAERRARFLREAKAASALNHPNVCTIYEVGGTEDGRPFLAMECLHGKTLEGAAQEKPLDNETIVEVAIQFADALDTAHQAGIIHRDIKPANMHLDDQGRVKVLDLGLAKWTGSEPSTDPQGTTEDHTEPSKVMGTPNYMSPEQTRGEALDPRSDLFSMVVVLYQLSTGRLPFFGVELRRNDREDFANAAGGDRPFQLRGLARVGADYPQVPRKKARRSVPIGQRVVDRFSAAKAGQRIAGIQAA